MILVDGMMLVRRCEAKMDFLSNSEGVPTGMEFGFLRTVESIQNKLNDYEIIICWDSKRNFKKEKYNDYKANRTSASEKFYLRLKVFKEFIKQLFKTCEEDGYEADDIMGSIVFDFDSRCYLYTNDKDLLQVVNDKTSLITSYESQLWRWDPEDVKEEFGCSPIEFTFYKVFRGDKVDNIQGIPRFPKKILLRAISGAKDLDSVVANLIKSELGPKSSQALLEFLAKGLHKKNYELVKLQKVNYKILPVGNNEEFIKEKLIEWEIGSLKLCKRFDLSDRFAGSEF